MGTSLRDLFHRADTLTGNTFRVHVQVTAVKDRTTAKMNHWQAELLCKDASTMNSNNHLGAKFFGDSKFSAGRAARFDGHVANMTRFNSFVDAIVERQNGFYYIKETSL